MQVHVPFAIGKGTHAWALDAAKLVLRQEGVDAQFHFLDHDEAYHQLLHDLWGAGAGFIVVEHDVVVWPGAIQGLENCPEQWCLYPYYSSMGWAVDALGCTKFGAGLLRQFPDALSEPFPDCCAHTRHWCGVDRLIAHRLKGCGLEPHVHTPGVVNLNDRWT